jgi:hypothetical protein
MRKHITTLCLTAALLLGLAACGDSSSSVSSAEAAASEAVSSQEESVLEESSLEESTLEDSTLEEEAEPTLDEQFAAFLSDASGVCLKLRVCDLKGNPIKNGTVTLSEPQEAAEAASDAETAEAEVYSAETDSSGYAFISELALDQEYTLTVYDQEKALVGTVSLKIESGDSYGGTSDEDSILLTVADDTLSNVDLAIIATDEDGTVSSFSLFRTAKWKDTTA